MAGLTDEQYALKLMPGRFVVIDINDYTNPENQNQQWRLYKLHSIDYDTCEVIEYDPDKLSQSTGTAAERRTYRRMAIPIAPHNFPAGEPIFALWPLDYMVGQEGGTGDFTTNLTTEYYAATVSHVKAKTNQPKVKARWIYFDELNTIPVPLITQFDQQDVPALMKPVQLNKNMVRLAVQKVRDAAAKVKQLQLQQQTATSSSSSTTLQQRLPTPGITAASASPTSTLKRKAESPAITTAAAKQQQLGVPSVKRQAITPTVASAVPSTTSTSTSLSTSTKAPTITIAGQGRTGLITPLPPSATITSTSASPAHQSILQQQQAQAQQPLITAEQRQKMDALKLEKQKEKKSWRVEWPTLQHDDGGTSSEIKLSDDIVELMKLKANINNDSNANCTAQFNPSRHYMSLLGNMHEWTSAKVLIEGKLTALPYVSNFY